MRPIRLEEKVLSSCADMTLRASDSLQVTACWICLCTAAAAAPPCSRTHTHTHTSTGTSKNGTNRRRLPIGVNNATICYLVKSSLFVLRLSPFIGVVRALKGGRGVSGKSDGASETHYESFPDGIFDFSTGSKLGSDLEKLHWPRDCRAFM